MADETKQAAAPKGGKQSFEAKWPVRIGKRRVGADDSVELTRGEYDAVVGTGVLKGAWAD